MELIITYQLRDDQLGRAITVETVRIRDLYAKQVEEVVEEITADLDSAIELVYEELNLAEAK